MGDFRYTRSLKYTDLDTIYAQCSGAGGLHLAEFLAGKMEIVPGRNDPAGHQTGGPNMVLTEHYEKGVKRFLENCTRCGLCAKGCPILPHTDIGGESPHDIQEAVYEFLEKGTPDPKVYTKAFACMACFKCTAGMCPQGLDPMLINEVIKGRYIARGLADAEASDPLAPDSAQKILASVLAEPEEYTWITAPDKVRKARYVFFPGCNVYFQPEKVLNALDIMETLGDDVAFLPGLDHCCGDSRLFFGDIEGGSRKADELVKSLAAFEPETVILWCPTCHCRFEKDLSKAMVLPFDIVSLPQYLAENMKRLPLTNKAAGTVTLHEPCKSAYTGVDLEGTRDVLRQLPGVTLNEMARHGKETVCCGSGAITWFPDSCDRVREERLKEAAETGAEKLVTVCHYCNQTFASEMSRCDFEVTNYVNLVAEAMGIRREDRFRKYALMGNLDRILDDAAPRITRSPFDRERIVEVLRSFFVRT